MHPPEENAHATSMKGLGMKGLGKSAVLFAAIGLLLYAGAYLWAERLVYRTGAYAPNGIPFANGFKDYVSLINERDGGVNGVKLVYEECETNYNTKIGVECYEKLKSNNPVVVMPNSTGITYQLLPKAPVDQIPVLSCSA